MQVFSVARANFGLYFWCPRPGKSGWFTTPCGRLSGTWRQLNNFTSDANEQFPICWCSNRISIILASLAIGNSIKHEQMVTKELSKCSLLKWNKFHLGFLYKAFVNQIQMELLPSFIHVSH